MKRKSAEAINLRANRSRTSMKRVSGAPDLGPDLADRKRFVFLSYAREDTAAAEALVASLVARDIAVSWDRLFEPGVAFDDQIEVALEAAAAVIVIWSEAALGSRYVRAEAAVALDLDKVVPVLVEGFEPRRLPFTFRGLQCCCVTDAERLLSALIWRGL